jgi:ubiquitin-protein ligase
MTDDRLNKEYAVLQEKLKDKTFRFLDFNTAKPNLVVAQQTNSGQVYTIKIDLSDFPNTVPDAFITNPKPLVTRTGEAMLGASHSMHTLAGVDGCTKICHYGPQQWSSNVSLYKVIIKIRFWLEAYETHLKTGENLSDYLAG